MHALVSIFLLQLSFRDVITGIPHDAGSIVVYAIFVLFLYGIWRGSKGKATEKSDAEATGAGKTGVS